MSKVTVKAKSVELRGNYAPVSKSYSTSTDVVIEATEMIVLPLEDDEGNDTGDTVVYTGEGAIITTEETLATFSSLVSSTAGSETT